MTDFDQITEDLGFEEDEYGVEDLITDLESSSVDTVEEDIVKVGDNSSSEEKIKYEAEDFINFLESEEDSNLEPSLDDENLDYSHDEDSDESDEDEGIKFSINELEIKNKNIKLDLWLNRCVDSEFIHMFLKYKSFSIGNLESPISTIISNFELEDILDYKYKINESDFKDVLMRFFLPMGVINLVDIAKKYSTSISLTKDGLIKNFLDTYTPYELIKIFDKEGLDIVPYLDIPILEQIYLLNDSKLEEISKKLCPYEDSAKIGMISCIVKYYDEGFLLSHNKLEGVIK